MKSIVCRAALILPCEKCGGSYGTDPADPTHGYPVCCGVPRKLQPLPDPDAADLPAVVGGEITVGTPPTREDQS